MNRWEIEKAHPMLLHVDVDVMGKAEADEQRTEDVNDVTTLDVEKADTTLKCPVC